MVVPLQWQARELGEGYAAVVVGVATLVVVAAALAARARWGPPESPESFVLVASIPVIVRREPTCGQRGTHRGSLALGAADWEWLDLDAAEQRHDTFPERPLGGFPH